MCTGLSELSPEFDGKRSALYLLQCWLKRMLCSQRFQRKNVAYFSGRLITLRRFLRYRIRETDGSEGRDQFTYTAYLVLFYTDRPAYYRYLRLLAKIPRVAASQFVVENWMYYFELRYPLRQGLKLVIARTVGYWTRVLWTFRNVFMK